MPGIRNAALRRFHLLLTFARGSLAHYDALWCTMLGCCQADLNCRARCKDRPSLWTSLDRWNISGLVLTTWRPQRHRFGHGFGGFSGEVLGDSLRWLCGWSSLGKALDVVLDRLDPARLAKWFGTSLDILDIGHSNWTCKKRKTTMGVS